MTVVVPALDTGPSFAQLEASLSPETLAALRRASVVRQVKAGDMIIREGETDDTLFFVQSGRFGVYRSQNANEAPFRVSEIGAGEPAGEMALLDGLPRSATVQCEADGTVTEVQPDKIRTQPNGQLYLDAFRGALAGAVTRRMRQANTDYVAALTRELELKQDQQQFGRFFIYVLVMMSIGTLVNYFVSGDTVHVDVYSSIFAWQYLIILLVPSAFVIWYMGVPLRSIGLTTVGLKTSLIEGVVASVVLCGLAVLIAQVLQAFGALSGTRPPFAVLTLGTYLVHSALQELLARGFLQSSFQRFLGNGGTMGSVLLASLFFGLFHIHFGLFAVFLTIVSGCIFGVIYARSQNLAGVTLVHFTAGIVAFSTGLI